MSNPDADALLVREAQAGNRAAFDMLVLKYQRRVERLLARSVRSPEDVADLCQETFLAAYRALPAFRGESAFYTWLYRIAVNAAQRHRSRHRPAGSLDDEDGTFGTEVAPTEDATPEALLASRQLAQGLNAAVEALAEDQRRALLLREVDGLSYEEIADLLDCPPGTVRSRIFRAREAVAARLRPLLGGGGGRRW
ncbi:sigma-70 family RNA polymerase sigma factor [Roseateles saccharophilus]|uniref:RNA polymerase RpoE-like sigma-24 subunit n=1 Tax=Roseateles saccharophilus TaxID=304 RepID=A0A4R3UP44_ROSSA|nr:sigma-70 family RNA polymerase sigma factor [Roseateles saccharophilus]MDG0833467.1 sigma-70 family RNA polymerase sigma factor [Roseateles saccharophilus]TCU92491.1 RNA polymerase RpoE-like sigma-24 subunit [Roseateles saccharophilus]